MEDFTNKFHSLDGVTLGERKKQLFLLLNSVEDGEEINVEKLRPKTALEEIFKIEAFIFFKKVPQLLEVLQSENTVFVQKVLNVSWWFVPEAFGHLNGNDLVNKIFPNLSYNTKLKLLHKLTQHLEEKCEEFFVSVKEKYGLFLASKLLPSCSGDFILEHLKRYKSELTSSELLRIIKNTPNLTEEIFEILDKHNYKTPVKDKYKKVFLYLASNENEKFLKLNEKYSPEITLGWTTSKKFIQNNRHLLTDNPKKIYKLVKQEQIPRVMREDFPKFYSKIFPKSFVDFQENFLDYFKFLKHISIPGKKYEILSQTFEEVYGNDIRQQEDLITESLLEIIPTAEREIWMDAHPRPDHITEISWISLRRLEKSLPLLKSKFEKSNTRQREVILQALVDTYKFNDDLVGLIDLFKYLLTQQKMLDGNCWKSFLLHFGQTIDLNKLSHGHWNYLHQIMGFVDFTNAVYCNWSLKTVYEGYLQYCFDNDLPYEDTLLKVLKIAYSTMITYPKKLPHERLCLLAIPSLLPKVYEQPIDLRNAYIDYLKRIRYLNKKKKHKISLFLNPELVEHLKNNLTVNNYTYEEETVLEACITREFEQSINSGLLSTFLSRKPTHNISPILMFLIKNHPSVLVECIKPLNTKKYINFPLHFYKYFDHLKLSQNVSEKCLEIIRSDDYDGDAKKDAAACLVHTMSTGKFLKFVSSYKSYEKFAKIETEEEKNVYKTQQGLLNSLNQVNPSSEIMKTILSFAQGDYLKLVNKSLFSNSQNLKEDNAFKYLKALKKKPVSAKKHGVMLSSRIYDMETFRIYLQKLTKKKEKNSTLKKSVLKANFNYFARNPETWLWELLKKNAKKIEDSEGYTILAQFEKVPLEYFTEYFIFTWNALDSNPNPEEMLLIIKCRFLECITENTLKLLPSEFCSEILEKHLFKSQRLNKFEKQIEAFASKYLIFHSTTSTHERINEIFTLIKNCIQTTWYTAKSAPLGRTYVYNFIKELCTHFLDKKCLSDTILTIFLNNWTEFLEPSKAFDHYAYLNLTLLYTKCLKEKWTQTRLGESLAQFLSLEKNLDMHIFSTIFESFKEKFGSIYKEHDVNESYLMIIEGVLKFELTTLCPLVLVLLPNSNALTLRGKNKLNEILNPILNDKSPTVQMDVHHFIRKRKVEEDKWDSESDF